MTRPARKLATAVIYGRRAVSVELERGASEHRRPVQVWISRREARAERNP